MPPRKEPCRNFQRGSCQYGERCKFLHVVPQQPKSNPFGFGSQGSFQSTNPLQSTNQQQTKSNPFAFDSQSNSQQRGANPFGFGVQSNSQQQNQYKPFQNKWTRPGTTNNSSVRQPDNQSAAPNHTCTDSDSCKRQIVEDFNNEKPLWMLTCYGHRKNGPCDISSDVSYEELRAAAYDDAKRGQSLMSIVERERNLLNSKVAEFDNLLRNPYVAPSTNAPPKAQNPFLGAAPNASLSGQNSSPPLTSSFSQLGALLNTGASAPPISSFGQPSPLGNSFKASSSSGANTSPFGNVSGSFGFGTQVSNQSSQNPFAPSNVAAGPERNSFSTSTGFSQFAKPSVGQLPTQGHFSASFASPPVSNNLMNASSREEISGDDSIWTKKWEIGEIPDEPPPERYV